MKDKCVSCGIETAYEVTTHVDMRTNYVEGVGQLCVNCSAVDRMYPESPNMDHLKHILVPVHVIRNTPNDAELGTKVRQLYYESKD